MNTSTERNGILLPPLPKLRRRPGLGKVGERQLDQNLITPPKKRKISEEDYSHHHQSPSEEDAQTSRLLTKSECGRGGGRSKKSSLIHSIPKFTEVVPNGNQEIKQLLQGRLLSKQQLSKQLPSSPIAVTVVEATTSHSLNSSTALCKNEGKQSRANHSSGTYPAANMLQSMVALHEKVCKGQIMTPKPLPIINKEVQRQQQQARKRKPDKSSICHLIPQVILREEPEPEITITPTTVLSRLSSPPDEKQPCTSIRSKISTESLESMSGVMRVRPNFQRKFDNNGSVDELQASHVSICKFKFHKGAKPSLEEKKMLSVDVAGGHFRYYSGEDSCTGSVHPQAVETLPREAMTANAGHLVTDRFTSLTADKFKHSASSSSSSSVSSAKHK